MQQKVWRSSNQFERPI